MQLLAVHEHVDIARLDDAHAVFAVEGESLLHLRLVVFRVGARLVVADQLHALAGGVFGDPGDVEVGIGLHETDPVGVLGPCAVPADVPSLGQHAPDAVLGGEVDVAHHVFGRGAVFGPLCPGLLEEVHRPPDADVLARPDPRRVLDLRRLVQVEHQARGGQIAGGVADDDRAPRRAERRPGVNLHAVRPRCEAAAQRRALLAGGAKAHLGVVR